MITGIIGLYARTAHHCMDASSVTPKARPPSSTLGHDRFNSMALMVAISSIIFASCTNSSTVPEIDNILVNLVIFQPVPAENGSRHQFRLAKPTEFKTPALVFTIKVVIPRP